MKTIRYTFEITESLEKERLDKALVSLTSDLSRSTIQDWIKSGYVTINKVRVCSPKHKVNNADVIEVEAKIEPALFDTAENIPLNIVFEDDHILIINKPAGLVSHPGAGNKTSTLVNALLHHDSELSKLPRAGLVHRLDKNTTRLLIVAKRHSILRLPN